MPVESKAMEHVKKVLGSFGDKYIENDTLKKNRVIEDLDAYEHELMEALLADEFIHEHYTEKIAGVEVFKLNQFISMFEFKSYWEDSYTKYSNKIGLSADGKFIDESADVVLDFPFKDTVLKAGMSKEDVEHSTDADEPFLNEVIAKAEIDELFEPKILVNAKKYDENNINGDSVHEISADDNLIIKGNNLVALHSLKQRYAGKVKLIYLDPPYNTGSDSFAYNDRFNHSTWLTFVTNRLKIAKELLKADGVIAVQSDNNEQAYLKVLMDEIFGVDSFVTTLHVQMSTTQGMKVRAAQKGNIVKNGEYIHLYSKNGHKDIAITPIYDIRPDYDTHYSSYIKDNGKIYPLYELYDYRYPKDLSNKKPLKLEEAFKQSAEFAKFVRVHQAEIVRIHQAEIAAGYIQTQGLKQGEYKIVKHQGKEYFLTVNGKGKINQLLRLSDSWGKTDSYKSPEGLRKVRGDWWPDFYLDMGNIKKEGDANFANGKKPERLISQIIKMITNKNDLIMDFFMGSATTQAVAMKMKRRFIGIEQMDYIENVSIPRLQKIISGEQGGISKDVNWRGGGSFVYAELMEKNQGYLHDLQKADTIRELMDVYARMKENADIDFRLDLEKFEEELDNFTTLEDRRRELVRILDKNQLYYNYANIDDANVKDLLSDSDYLFNKSFYQEKDGK